MAAKTSILAAEHDFQLFCQYFYNTVATTAVILYLVVNESGCKRYLNTEFEGCDRSVFTELFLLSFSLTQEKPHDVRYRG